MTGFILPKVRAVVVGIKDHTDAESIAAAAAHASLELLLRETSQGRRAKYVIDRVAIVEPVDSSGRRGALDFLDMIYAAHASGGPSKYAVVVTVRELPEEKAEDPE